MGNPAQRPSISVIIPTYNRARFVREAIDSVLAQDCRNFELLVIDDGSTDNTLEILDDYRDSIRVIRQENRGVSAARNAGIRQAAGDYIALLDSDDLWEKNKLSVQARFFSEYPDAQICQTEEIWIRNGRRVNPAKKHKKPSGMIFEPSLELCLVSPSAVMIKKTVFDQVGFFDEALPACEDYDLWLRISIRMPIWLTPEPCVIKRGGHRDQLSAAPGLDRFRIDSLQKILSNELLTDKQRRKAIGVLHQKCRIYANGCDKRNRKDEAASVREIARKFPA